MATLEERLADNPFPGLRSFQPDEADMFFGRQRQIDDLLARLAEVPLVAVAGASGCGKSSLVLAGLLRALERRHAQGDPVQWRPVVMRPGNEPIANLARPLAAALAPAAALDDPTRAAALAGRLRLGGGGLVEAVRLARLPANVRVLVVVDQFEEIFRYRRMTDADECTAFVKLLLQAANETDAPVQVVLTMRSDSLGFCADFRGLPEAVSRGQFLVPRLTREQRKQAITGPVERRGFKIAPRLVQRLLNDVSDDFDDLPVMQHVLACTWRQWAGASQGSRPVDLEDYQKAGEAKGALSQHADDAFESLAGLGGVVERIFRALTERVAGAGSEVRRPLPLATLCEVTGAIVDDVKAVVERYRRADTVFLLPAANIPLEPGTVIDISHESLIRGWTRLRRWADDEALSAQAYRRIAEAARRHLAGDEGLLRNPSLSRALDWRTQNRPHAAWGRLYDPDFQQAMTYLDASREARNRGLVLNVASVAVLVLAIAGVVLYWQRQASEEAEQAEATRRATELANEHRAASRALALKSSRLLAAGRLDGALLLGAAALKEVPVAEEAQEIMRKVMEVAPRGHLRGFEGTVTGLAFDGEGSQLAAVSDAAGLGLRDLADGKTVDLPAFEGLATDASAGPLVSAAIDAMQNRFARVDAQGRVHVWNARTGQALETRCGAGGSVGEPAVLAFSPDGRMLAVAPWNGEVLLCDLAAAESPGRGVPGLAGPVASMAFSGDGGKLAVVGSGGALALWDTVAARLTPIVRPSGAKVSAAALSADASLLAVGDNRGEVSLWSVAAGTWRDSASGGHVKQVTALRFSADGRTLASGGLDESVLLWAVDRPDTPPRRLMDRHGAVSALAFSGDGSTLAAAAGAPGVVVLWDLSDSGVRHGLFAPSQEAVYAVAFDPAGNRLAMASNGLFLGQWDVAHGRMLPVPPSAADRDALTSVAYSPSGDRVATGTNDHHVFLRAVKAEGFGEPEAPAGTVAHQARVCALAFSRDGRLLASGDSDNAVLIWDLVAGTSRRLPLEEIAKIDNKQPNEVTGLAFDHQGRLAIANRNGSVIVVDVSVPGHDRLVGRPMTVAGSFMAVSFVPPDDRLLVAGDFDGKIRFWDVARGASDGAILDQRRSANGLAPDPSGLLLASAGDDGSVRLWDVVRRRQIGQPFEGHESAVFGVAFRCDGKTVASAGGDGLVGLWDVEVERWPERACAIVGPDRPIEDGEWPRNVPTTGDKGQQPAICPPGRPPEPAAAVKLPECPAPRRAP